MQKDMVFANPNNPVVILRFAHPAIVPIEGVVLFELGICTKFLLKDVTESAKLESADLAIDLFDVIERNKHVSLRDGRYLAECFCLMERMDLVKMLNTVL
jgi:hypothetical protein